MKNEQLIKNKIDLQYNALMQERSAILIALTGLPLTAFNVALSVFRLELPQSLALSLISFLIMFFLKTEWDRKMEEKLEEINLLMKK